MAKKENIEEAEVTEVAEVKEVKQTKKTTKKTAKAETDPEVEKEAPVVNEEAADEKKDKKTVKKTAKVTTEVEVNEEVTAPQEEAPTVKKEAPKPVEDPVEVSVEQKLVALYTLQQVDSKIDEIRAYRGNLPLEIQDMEDEIAGLETRIANFKEESKKHQKDISDYKIKIKETEALIKKYEDQQNNVRNNREYDSLTKEIEYQQLDNQLSEKRIKEITAKDNEVAVKVAEAQMRLTELKSSLKDKKDELHSLVEGTEKEEEQLLQRSAECEKLVEDRLLVAYKRIRKNARNGLAVVGIFDEACGGCFNRIPPQHQLDICTHKKIIVCEYCGRILVDKGIIEQYNA
jgi:predicted  nucleic acid-binding Zn-ribbon protein